MRHLIFSLLGLIALTGCSVFTEPKSVKKTIEADFEKVKARKRLRADTPFVVEFDRMYVKPLSKKEAEMPDWLSLPVSKHFRSDSLNNILQESFSGLPVNFELREGVSGKSLIRLDVDGTYRDILDAIRSKTGYNYEIHDKTIILSKYVVEIFHIEQLAGDVSFAVGRKGIRGAGSGGQGNSSGGRFGNQTIGGDAFSGANEEYSVLSGNINVLQDVKLAVNSILGCKKQERSLLPSANTAVPASDIAASNLSTGSELVCDKGADAQVLPSASSILVKGLPSQIAAVRRFVKMKNDELTRQVMIDISLVNVEFNNNTQLAVDFDLINKSFRSWGQVTLNTTAGSGIIGGLDPRGVFSVQKVSQGANPSTLFLEALAKQGAVSEKRYPRVVAINNRVGTVANIDRENFIAQRSVVTTANVGNNIGIRQSTAETGYTLHALPNIGQDNIILHLSTSLSALLDLERKGDESSEVESPRINDKMFNTTIRVKDGVPLIIAGLSDNSQQYQGSDSALISGLSRSTRKRNVETLLMIKATVI